MSTAAVYLVAGYAASELFVNPLKRFEKTPFALSIKLGPSSFLALCELFILFELLIFELELAAQPVLWYAEPRSDC